MTNILALITVCVATMTNDIPRWSPQVCYDGPSQWIMYFDESSSGSPVVEWDTGKTNYIRFPTYLAGVPSEDERVRVVSTKRITTLNFMWAGKPRKIIEEELLSETRKRIIKQERWIEQ